MTNSTELLSLDINSLSLVTGGNGPLQVAGQKLGTQVGTAVQPLLPAPIRPVAPPAGGFIGGQIGAWADRQIGRFLPVR